MLFNVIFRLWNRFPSVTVTSTLDKFKRSANAISLIADEFLSSLSFLAAPALRPLVGEFSIFSACLFIWLTVMIMIIIHYLDLPNNIFSCIYVIFYPIFHWVSWSIFSLVIKRRINLWPESLFDQIGFSFLASSLFSSCLSRFPSSIVLSPFLSVFRVSFFFWFSVPFLSFFFLV